MAEVVFDKVRKAFAATVAVHDLDLTIDEGEFVCLSSPSGGGSSERGWRGRGTPPCRGGWMAEDRAARPKRFAKAKTAFWCMRATSRRWPG